MVLENKLGIQDASALAREEERLSKKRALELFDNKILDKLEAGTFKSLQEIHRYLFQDIYDFAGKFRNVDIEKNACSFVKWQEIGVRLQNEFELMNNDLTKVINVYDFAEHLAKYYVEITYIHPFREGNGRSIREFIREYANEKSKCLLCGPLEFLWSKVDIEQINRVIHFSIAFHSAITLEFLKALVPVVPEIKR